MASKYCTHAVWTTFMVIILCCCCFFLSIWSSEAPVRTLVSSETCSHLTEHDSAVIAEPEPIPDINRNNKSALSGRHLYCVGRARLLISGVSQENFKQKKHLVMQVLFSTSVSFAVLLQWCDFLFILHYHRRFLFSDST